MSGLQENGMSNAEVLAVVNKIHNHKSRTQNKNLFPRFSGYYKVSFTHFWFSKVELDHGNKWKDTKSRCA
jgi:hypothetical protein